MKHYKKDFKIKFFKKVFEPKETPEVKATIIEKDLQVTSILKI